MTSSSRPPVANLLSGARVVAFEGRRGPELASLVTHLGGLPFVAAALREVRLEPGPDVMELAQRLRKRDVDGILFLTAGGVEALPDALRGILPREELLDALGALPIGARGPKTLAAVSALLPDHSQIVPSEEPHTHRELVRAFDRVCAVGGAALVVVEHAVPHVSLRAALMDAGAQVLSVALYRWVLPEDVTPLLEAISRIVEGRADIVLFTNGAQIEAAMGVAAEQDLDEPFRDELRRVVVGAIGEVTADRLRAFGVEPDVIPARSRMTDLARAVAAHVAQTRKETGS